MVDQKDVDFRLHQSPRELLTSPSSPKTLVTITLPKILGDVRRFAYPDTQLTASLEDFPEVNARLSIAEVIKELRTPNQDRSDYLTRFEKLAFSVGGEDLGGIWCALLNSGDRLIRKLFQHLGIEGRIISKEMSKMVVILATRQSTPKETKSLDKVFSGPTELAVIYSELITPTSSPVAGMVELLEISEQLQHKPSALDQAAKEHFALIGRSVSASEHQVVFQRKLDGLMRSLHNSLQILEDNKSGLLRVLSTSLLWIKFGQGISAKDVFRDPNNGIRGKDPLSLFREELSLSLGDIVDRVEQVITR